MLPAVSMLAGQLSRLRDRLRRQKAELPDALARIQELATRDELTGLANRRHMQRADRAGARALRCARASSFCLAVLDIDHFKRINDTHGHPAGDRVLRDFAREALRRLRVRRRAVALGRRGVPADAAGHARSPLARLGRRAAAHARRGAAGGARQLPPLSFTLSAGVVEHRAGESVVEAIARADRALYQAKQQGRNKVVSGRPEAKRLCNCAAQAARLRPARPLRRGFAGAP